MVIVLRYLRFSSCVAPSLTRGRVCNLLVQLLLGLASAVTLGSKSHRTSDHTLLSLLGLDSLFVAFYDLQGYGGGMLVSLHTGATALHGETTRYIAPARTDKEISLRKFYCCECDNVTALLD
jgi:hypothetical protein